MKKNILFVVDEKRMGGVSVLLEDILNNINIKKYNIDIAILHNAGDYLNNLPKSINIIYGTSFFNTVDLTLKQAINSKSIKIIYSKLRLILLMKTKLIKNRIIKERKKMFKKTYDIEIAFKDGFCAIFTAYGDSIKKYHWLHSDYAMYDCTARYKCLFKDVFPRFNKIIAISNSVLERFNEKYHTENNEVIFNIIDSEKIINKSKEENIKYDNKKINLVSVGRIHEMKGYDRLIDVLHELDQDNKLNNVITRIVGDGPNIEVVKEKIRKYHLEEKVILMGKKKNPFPYVKASDVFIMCSRYEPFGLVILEALILKVPVLSVNVASIKEIMNNKQGIIVENSNKGLYEGLEKIIKDKTLIDKYKKELSNYKYDIQRILKQIEGLLDE